MNLQTGTSRAEKEENRILGRIEDWLERIGLRQQETLTVSGDVKVTNPNRQDTIYVSQSVTRPNDANAYTAGDAIGNSTTALAVAPLEFKGAVGKPGGNGVILDALLVDSTNETTLGQFELWLFDQNFVPDADNAVFTPSDSECLRVVAIIQFNTGFAGTAGTGGNTVYPASAVNMGFTCEPGKNSLYGALVVRNAYTPVALETFTIRLVIMPAA